MVKGSSAPAQLCAPDPFQHHACGFGGFCARRHGRKRAQALHKKTSRFTPVLFGFSARRGSSARRWTTWFASTSSYPAAKPGGRQFDVVKQLLAPSGKSTVHRRKASAKAGGGWLSCTSELVNVRPADTVRWRGKNLRDSSAAVVGHKIDLVGVRPPTSV